MSTLDYLMNTVCSGTGKIPAKELIAAFISEVQNYQVQNDDDSSDEEQFCPRTQRASLRVMLDLEPIDIMQNHLSFPLYFDKDTNIKIKVTEEMESEI